MRPNKPIPRTPLDIDNDLFTPYISTDGKPSMDEHPFNINRGINTSFKGDTVQNVSIGLQDIDNAILYYFNEVIQPTIIQDGNKMTVRTIYGNPERWKSVQQDGFYRDSNNQIITPLIMIKRDTVEKARGLGNKIDGNTVALYQTIGTKYNKRNAYDKFDILNNRIPSEQYYISTVPDYINVTYNCIIFTNFVEQNNKIVEAIEFASDSYWGDINRYKFRANIDSFSTTNIIENSGDKVAKSTFNVKMYGYIIPDTVNKDLATVRSKFYTRSQVVFDLEVVETIGGQTLGKDSLKFANKPITNATNATSFIGGGVNVTNNITINNTAGNNDLAYLNTNNFATASAISDPTASFTNYTIVQPPAGSTLPATSKTNFAVYRNGQYIGNEYITSISQVGSNIIVIVDTGLLGYNLESTDTIDLIGKLTGSI